MSKPPLTVESMAPQEALSLASTHVPVASPDSSTAAIRQALMDNRYDSATDIAVCENERLLGLIRIESLLAAQGDVPAGELMDENYAVVRATVDQEVAAWAATQARRRVVAVVDNDDRFLGLIPPEHLLTVLLAEHEEDLSRLGGFMHGASSAREAAEEAIRRRFLHRLPWLLIGLIGAFMAAGIISAFEGQLAGNVTLLFFIPSVVYLADAVGTQTETIVIRGLSVGVSIRRIIRRELLTGLLVGLAIAATFFPLAVWWWGDVAVAWVVSLSLMAACSIATVVAMALPWLFHRLGADPAFGSGPLATVIQDLLTVFIYLVIAVLLVGSAA